MGASEQMTRAQTQLLLIVLYGIVGIGALLTPGLTADIYGIASEQQSAATLMLIRIFGASSLFIAVLLFFFIANVDASRRIMLTAAMYEGAVILAMVLALLADSPGTRTVVVSIVGSLLLALLNLWGSLIAPRGRGESSAESN